MNITETSDTPRYNNSGYYLTPDLSQRLDLISHLLANTQLVPYVQAAEGCGKSRLTHHLADTLAQRYTVFLIEGESGITAKALRSQLSEATGAAPHEVVDDEQLDRQVNALYEKNKTLLILVDDAEQLPSETLTWLAETLTSRQETLFIKCVILAAVDVLALPLSPVLLSTLKDRIQTLDIPPITPGQLPGFVASVDPLKSAVIDETQYAALMKNSSGIIGKILWQLQYIDNSPLPQQEMESVSSNRMSALYVVAAILFVSALVSVLVFQDEINLSMSENKSPAQEAGLEVINLPLPPPVVAVQENDTTELDPKPEPEPEPGPEPEPEPENEAVTATVSEHTDIEIAVPQEVPEEVVPAFSQQPESEIAAAQNSGIENPTVTETVEGENELKVEPEKKPEESSVPVQTAVLPVVTKETQAVKPVEAPSVVSSQQVPVTQQQQRQGEGLQPVDWILNQPDKSYTLQLLAVSDEKGIKRFLKQHNFSGNFVILQTRRNGKPWYALLFETYASRDEALNARKNLPKSYKSASAWPRSILSIRQAIDAN